MCFSVTGHSGQNHKMAVLSLKINFFLSRFGFLVQFYSYSELGLKKYSHDQELLICGDNLKFKPTVHCVGLCFEIQNPSPPFNPRFPDHLRIKKFLFFKNWKTDLSNVDSFQNRSSFRFLFFDLKVFEKRIIFFLKKDK
jgi:hypothetical protein